MNQNESKKIVCRGQICYYNFPYIGKHVQYGNRPCVVIGNNKQNRFSETVVVVPVTSSRTKKDLPTHVDIPYGYNVYGMVTCEQIFSVNVNDLTCTDYILNEKTMNKITRALSIELDIESDTILRDTSLKNKDMIIDIQKKKIETLESSIKKYYALLNYLNSLNMIVKDCIDDEINKDAINKLEEQIKVLKKM